jgi:hypothetical protein
MADSTPHSAPPPSGTEIREGASTQPDPLGHLPPAPPPGDRPSDPFRYQPLSVLALIGFGISALYALIVLLVGGVAFFRGIPLMWPWATLLIPLLAAGVSVAAWIQIQRSEGTRAGAGLARWGLVIAVLVGLGFASYMAATGLVVRKQADEAARRWLEALRDGNIDEAFVLTLPPDQRPAEGPDFRSEVEQRFNQPDPRSPVGAVGMFRQADVVQFFTQGGKEDVVIEPRGVMEMKYDSAGYTVRLQYHVTTRMGSAEVIVSLTGSQGGRGRFARQWMVRARESGFPSEAKPQATPTGDLLLQARERSAHPFVEGWLHRLSVKDTLTTYRDTRPRAEHDRLVTTMLGRAVLSGAAQRFAVADGLELSDPALSLPGFDSFASGGFLKIDPKHFWSSSEKDHTSARERKRILDQVRPLFRSALALQMKAIVVQKASDFPWERNGDTLRVQQNILINRSPEWVAEATAVLEADAHMVFDEHKLPLWWRVAEVRLLSWRKMDPTTGGRLRRMPGEGAPPAPGPGGPGGR